MILEGEKDMVPCYLLFMFWLSKDVMQAIPCEQSFKIAISVCVVTTQPRKAACVGRLRNLSFSSHIIM